MRKLIFGFLVLMTTQFMAYGQGNLCDEPCTPGPVQTYQYNICQYNWYGEPYGPGTGFQTVSGPCVFVIVNYRVMTCGGVTSLVIDDAVLVDNRFYWDNIFKPYPAISNQTIPACTFTLTAANIRAGIKTAIDGLVASIGLSTNIDVYFKGACFSLVTVRFPQGAFIPQPPDDLGHRDTIQLDSSTITQRVPCNDVCCKVTYEYRVVMGENGHTIQTWVPISISGDEVGCANAPLPNYSTYTPKTEAMVYDSATGGYISVPGTLVGQELCQLTCSTFLPPPPDAIIGFQTDVVEQKVPITIELSATPTLFNNFIRFTSNKEIVQVAVYDMSGRKVLTSASLENNELNTTELKSGMYFVQVYLSENVVRTIKVVKQ